MLFKELVSVIAFASLACCDRPMQQFGLIQPANDGHTQVSHSEPTQANANPERISITLIPGDRHPIRTLLNIRSAMRYGEYRWNEEGVPSGPLWVRVDLRRQLLSVIRGQDEIGTTVILYGADLKPTPVGNFQVLARFKDHRSGPYGAPMPYTLRLTTDGVSIHGSNVHSGAATHGCIGVPVAFAKKLFDQVRVGDEVLIAGDAGKPILT